MRTRRLVRPGVLAGVLLFQDSQSVDHAPELLNDAPVLKARKSETNQRRVILKLGSCPGSHDALHLGNVTISQGTR